MKYAIIATIFLSACVAGDPELQAHLEAEQDFHASQQYQEDVANHTAFRPEVYADVEFLSDCEFYQMEECYE